MITIASNSFDEVKEFLATTGKYMPQATAYLLNRLGYAARDAVRQKMPDHFHKPTPWVVGGVRTDIATTTNLVVKIEAKKESFNALAHHIEGGGRPAKMFEKRLRSAGILVGAHQYVVPARSVKRNQYGNVSRGLVNKVLSSMGAQFDERANTTLTSAARNKTQGDFFVVPRSKGTHPGIYQRKGAGANTRLDPIFLFVSSTRYKRRWPFHEIADDAAYDEIPRAIDKTIQRLGW